MFVNAINNSYNTSFQQKKIYLDKRTHSYLKELLPKINRQAVYVENDTNYKSSFLKELSVDDFTLIDGRTLIKPVPEAEQIQSETLIDYGASQIVIKNSNGEVIDGTKPLFSSWETILENVSKYIKFIAENFENTQLVKRKRLPANGLTEAGQTKQDKLNAEFKKLEDEILKR